MSSDATQPAAGGGGCGPGFAYAPADLAAAPAVTVVTLPGAGAVLHGAENALAGQSFQAWEWLIAHDGAAGAQERARLEEYRQRDPRVRVIAMPEQRGAAAVRNAVFAAARSRYVVELAGGAGIGPTALEELYWFIETHPECAAADACENAGGAGERGSRKRWFVLDDRLPESRPRPLEAFEDVRPAPAGVNRLARGGRRLLMLIPRMSLGGAERAALELLKQLAGRGWEVSIAALQGGDEVWTREFQCYTPDVFVLPRFLRLPDYPGFLQYLIDSRRPEFVLTSGSELGYQLLPYLCSTCPEPVYIDLCHSEAPQWKNGGYARYAAACQDYVDLTLVTSEHLKRYIVGRGGDAARIEVLYLNVDAELWRPSPEARERVRRELGVASDEALLLFAGRLDAEKQPRVLAETLHRLAGRKQRFRAVLAGEGAERAWLEEFIRRRRLGERVNLLGEVRAQRLRELMAAADIFFLPSLWEGIALTIYEAMACGLAVVGADVGGQRELVTPDCGLLLPKRTEFEEEAAYTAALERLISDAQRRQELGRNARQRIEERFTLTAMADRFFELLERGRALRKRANRVALPPSAARESAAVAIELTRVNDVLNATWREAQSLWRDSERLSAGQGQRVPDSAVNLLRVLCGVRHRLFPPGSWRERMGRRGMHALRCLRQ